jgi:hypothetical protein
VLDYLAYALLFVFMIGSLRFVMRGLPNEEISRKAAPSDKRSNRRPT